MYDYVSLTPDLRFYYNDYLGEEDRIGYLDLISGF